MEVFELAPGLWRWTGRRDTIGAEVSCVYYKTGTEVILFDPLLPPEDPDGFWRALDRDVLPTEAQVHVLITRAAHTRSAGEMASRYPGTRVWATNRSRPAVAEQAGVATETIEPGTALPGGVEAHPSGRDDEVVFWVPEHRALVIGDALMGDGAGGLRLPEATLAPALRPLQELDVAFVLPSHGAPPPDGAAALRAALG